jgi:6-phosphogluconolactonase
MAATLHIGTYEDGGGGGLVPVSLDSDGTLTAGEPLQSAPNASFGVRVTDKAYLTDERDPGAVSVLQADGDGWRRLAHVPTGGAEPCFVECDGAMLAAANYASGNLTLWRIGDDGLPQEPPEVFESHGSGPQRDRQEGPHVHCVKFAPDSRALFAVDLGADTVWRLPLLDGGKFGPAERAWRAPPGSGPRQLRFLPNGKQALVLTELASTLFVLDVRPDGTLCERDTASTLPDGFKGESLGGHLEWIDGRALVSNRGHNSLAVFGLEGGKLALLGHVSSGGAHPRHFAQVGNQLVIVHEKDGRVTSFDLAAEKLPQSTGRFLRVPGACFALA